MYEHICIVCRVSFRCQFVLICFFFAFSSSVFVFFFFFFFQAEDGIRDKLVTGVQTCALPIFNPTYVARLQDEHERGVANHRKLLWTLLMFELWHESFVETPRRIETSVVN